MGLQRSPVQKFGGLNTVVPSYDLQPGEAPDMANVRYPTGELNQESIDQRKGFKTVASGFTGGAPALASIPFHAGINRNRFETVLFGEGDIWKVEMQDTNIQTIDRLFDAGVGYDGRWSCCSYAPGSAFPKVYAAPVDSLGASTPPAKVWDGTAIATWVNNFPGPNGNIRDMVSWRGRIVAIGSTVNRVYYTDVGSDSTLTNFIDIVDQNGSDHRGLLVHNNNLYLIKEDSIWMIYDPVSFANRLLCTVGCGKGTMNRLWVSCPVDRRIYWFNSSHGLVYSSNGENDLIIENTIAPLPQSQLDTTSVAPLVVINHAQMAYDPQQQSILINWQTQPGVGVDADRLDEICIVIGKPGAHPILRHQMHTFMLCTTFVRFSTAVPGRREAVVCSSSQNLTKVYDVFGQVGSDDGTAISPCYWHGGWMPIISEEPWERVRRVNFLYRGDPSIDIYSTMAALNELTGAPTLTLNPADNTATFPAAGDLQFVSMRGPNHKGRYHKVKVNGPAIVGKDFSISALEFAIRGGKGHK